MRYGGEVSIGHSFFVALGAYTVAIVEHQFGLSLLVSLPIATALGAAAGFVFAFPSRRLSGIYLAVATMALALALPEILIGFEKITGGFQGLYIALDPVPGVPKALQRYYVALAVLGLMCLALAQFRRSPQGMALLMARAQPRAAEAIGITGSWARISIFTLSAALSSCWSARSSASMACRCRPLWPAAHSSHWCRPIWRMQVIGSRSSMGSRSSW